MSHTYSNIAFHILFGTKRREHLISKEQLSGLHACIGALIKEQHGVPMAVGGVSDHVHILVGWRTDQGVADLVREVKRRSNAWMRGHGCADFAWQNGYTVFSVSASVRGRVRRYIENQEEHHRRMGFAEELDVMIRACGIEA